MKNRGFQVVVGLGALALLLVTAPAGAQGVLFVKNNRVGIGTDNPSDPLHVLDNSGSGAQIMARFTNNGAPFIRYEDTSIGISWALQPTTAGDFTITKDGTGGPEILVRGSGQVRIGPGASTVFDLSPSGNLTISGTLTQGSSRALKKGFELLDAREVLDRVSTLDVVEWSYKNQGARHIGPMAEDFHSAFGLGEDATHLAPGDLAGVTLVALQGLQQVVAEKDQHIERLSRELAELRGVVEALAAAR